MKEILGALCLCLCISACKQSQNQGETIVVSEGVEIPIKACVEANSKILGNLVEPVAFCKCLIPKFYENLKNDQEKLKLLKDGDWYNLSNEKQELVTKYYQDCITQTATTDSTAKLTITPRMAEGMKKRWKQELIDTEIEKSNDVDKYCDCLISGMQTDFTAKEIMQSIFNETETFQILMEKCLRTTKKK